MWGSEREGREKLQGSRLTVFDNERRRQWRGNARSLGALDEIGLGQKNERGLGIYMGGSTWRTRKKSQQKRRGFPLGFVRGVRVHHGGVEVMTGGACLSARGHVELGRGPLSAARASDS